MKIVPKKTGATRSWHILKLRLLLIIAFFHSTSGTVKFTYFKGIPGCTTGHILPRNYLYSFTTKSSVECVTICGRIAGCYFVNICESSHGFTCDILRDLDPAVACRHLQHDNAQALMVANPCLNGGTYTKRVCYCIPGFAGTLCERYVKSCNEAKDLGVTGLGFYKIQPEGSSVAYTVFCNCYAGTIWAMKRIVKLPSYCPSNSFNRTWEEYKKGFGTIDCGYFLGLETIHKLTGLRSIASLVDYQFNIYNELSNYNEASSMYLEAAVVGDESSNYEISFIHEWNRPDMTGDKAFDDTIKPRQFCTWDNDCGGCGKSEGGGWWFTPTCGGGPMTVVDADKMVWPVNGVDMYVANSWIQLDDHGEY